LRDARHVSWGAVLLEDEALTTCVTAVPMVVTLSICSKALFPSLYLHLSTTKPAYFRATYTPEKTASNMLKSSN